MEISSGDFIVESAGDDISLPERTERLVAAWLASGRRAGLVHSEKRDIDADGNPLAFAPREGILADIAPAAMLAKKHALIGATDRLDARDLRPFRPDLRCRRLSRLSDRLPRAAAR